MFHSALAHAFGFAIIKVENSFSPATVFIMFIKYSFPKVLKDGNDGACVNHWAMAVLLLS